MQQVGISLGDQCGGSLLCPLPGIGTYQLDSRKPGFKKMNRAYVMNAALHRCEAGDRRSLIDAVTAAAPLLETDTAVVGEVFDTKEVHEIPMMQAKAQNLMYYMESAQVNNDGTFHILGLPPALVAYSIDGAAIKQSVRSAIGTTTTAITPPVDSIAEAQVWSTTGSSRGNGTHRRRRL